MWGQEEKREGHDLLCMTRPSTAGDRQRRGRMARAGPGWRVGQPGMSLSLHGAEEAKVRGGSIWAEICSNYQDSAPNY